MTIASATSRISYTGDGGTVAFAVPFYFAANADLVVYLQDSSGNQTLQVLGTHYTLTGATLAAGGTCTFVTAPTATTGAVVSIYRDPPITQVTSYNNNDPFPAKSHETALDKLTTIGQRTRDLVNRALHIGDAESSATLTTLASTATRKNKLLGFGTSGELTYPLGPTFVSGTYVGVAEVDSRATAQVTSFAASINVVVTQGYVTPGDGGGSPYKRVAVQPTHSGKFQSAAGAWWEVIPGPDGINAKAFGATGNGITDDTAAIQAAVDYADGQTVFIPTGTYSVSQISRLTSTSSQWRNGMRLVGQGRGSNLVANTNSKAVLLWDVGYTPDGTITPTLKFTRDSEVRSLLITQAGGVTATDGIKLTAAWNVRITDVWVEGMSGKGINVPWRADIYAAVSDYWQCFAFDIQQCRFSECTDWGVYFGGGQSPGLWRMQYCTIANNVGGGIFATTGHFVLTDNLIVANGAFAGNGGMLMDASIEPAALVATVERNEFDTNFVYHLWLMRSRNHRIAQNRFLSQTYNSNTGSTLTSGSAFMRPAIHVKLGDGATDEVWNTLFEENYHRSVTGAGPTTAAVSGYIMTPGSTSVLRNRFVNNEMGFRDGVNLNSTGMTRYTGINTDGDANSIVDGNRVGLSVSASGATAVAGTATPITFGTSIYDTHIAWASPNFTAPVAGRYKITTTIEIAGLTLGNTVTLAVYVNAAATRTSLLYAGGLANESFHMSADLLLAETDIVSIRALQNNGANKNTVADSSTRLAIVQES